MQLYYALFVHLRLKRYKIENIPTDSAQGISVIICARNEAENLRNYLPLVLKQNYATFEVIVVNDRSWDDTKMVLEAFKLEYPNLKLVQVLEASNYRASKKFAVTMGIKAAQYDWLVFTDADCYPASENWLRAMQPQHKETEIVLGYSPYIGLKGVLNALVRYETFFTAINYLSFALKGMPYMGVGRNLAYKKSLFFKNKGFASHMHIPSGDDDLFVNAHAHAANTEIRLHPDTHMWTLPKTSLRDYLRQKKRHFGAGKLYKAKHKMILSFQVFIQLLYYCSFVACLFFEPANYLALGLFALSLVIRSLIYPQLLKRLNYPDLRWYFPILDLLLWLFLSLNGLLVSLSRKKVFWK